MSCPACDCEHEEWTPIGTFRTYLIEGCTSCNAIKILDPTVEPECDCGGCEEPAAWWDGAQLLVKEGYDIWPEDVITDAQWDAGRAERQRRRQGS